MRRPVADVRLVGIHGVVFVRPDKVWSVTPTQEGYAEVRLENVGYVSHGDFPKMSLDFVNIMVQEKPEVVAARINAALAEPSLLVRFWRWVHGY
jgi:hypothetical protein